ncbi:MAG TPA: N-acetyl-gamma-glutamyl-phosphate reductase [Myxococcota bacterium]|nr:N-acetyl-gamma-glutamyl-phosphate reductase [Myxococcota bacterium]
MRPRVFIDGHAGTTGLRIRDGLAGRDDLELLTLPEPQRKDAGARREALRGADLAVLCLPDDAAREVAGWAEGSRVRVLDASTAHRVAEGWVYGLPELEAGQRDAIAAAPRVSNPGCYPTGVVLLLRPLVDAQLLPREAPLSIRALSGYSGGGHALIERWEDPALGLQRLVYEAPYSLERVHKHVPEMQRFSGLAREPQFVPAVGPFRCGMRVEVPLHAELLARGATGKAIWEAIAERYRGERFVRVAPYAEPAAVSERSLDPQAANDTNRVDLFVLPHPSGHVLLVAILDNLGKGAAGAAIQNLNRMLGLDEAKGLRA